ncbi:MAG TPA: hypothetical protein V6C91_20835 [Coleofasciculaceae cyanobacterium]
MTTMTQMITNARIATVESELSTTRNTRVSTFTGCGGNIPDGHGSFQDDIVVTDKFKVTDVTVTLENLAHTWVGDLIVRLRHLETDTVVELFRRPGQPHFSSSGYCNDLNGDYSFNDRYAYPFDVAAATNSVIPTGNYTSLQSLSVFNGLLSAGTWRINITDCSAGDSGSLGSWRLDLGWE